jgi:plastocyanin
MSRRLTIGISILVVVLVIGVSVFVFMREDTSPAALQESSVEEISQISSVERTIQITSDGFTPKDISVKRGDKIIFINSDDSPAWPASDFHPSHDIYPTFDAGKGIDPGESWDFVFDQVGTWRFHDHLLPARRGVITVE